MTSCIYFIQEVSDEAPIKIGIAADPVARLRNLQSGNPRGLVLVTYVEGVTREDERRLHNRLAADRITGEWFASTDEVCSVIDMFIEKHDEHSCGECGRQHRILFMGWRPTAIRAAHTCGAPLGTLLAVQPFECSTDDVDESGGVAFVRESRRP